jgi:hypothetical protein
MITIENNLVNASIIRILSNSINNKQYCVEFGDATSARQDEEEVWSYQETFFVYYYSTIKLLLLEIIYYSYNNEHTPLMVVKISGKDCTVNIKRESDQKKILKLLYKHKKDEPTPKQIAKQMADYLNSYAQMG